jgi:hypothetical protein
MTPDLRNRLISRLDVVLQRRSTFLAVILKKPTFSRGDASSSFAATVSHCVRTLSAFYADTGSLAPSWALEMSGQV